MTDFHAERPLLRRDRIGVEGLPVVLRGEADDLPLLTWIPGPITLP
ncbi:hypothetical protein [Catenulispora rubra]|nr:hypothetical protein [Catenulispora rubra]